MASDSSTKGRLTTGCSVAADPESVGFPWIPAFAGMTKESIRPSVRIVNAYAEFAEIQEKFLSDIISLVRSLRLRVSAVCFYYDLAS